MIYTVCALHWFSHDCVPTYTSFNPFYIYLHMIYTVYTNVYARFTNTKHFLCALHGFAHDCVPTYTCLHKLTPMLYIIERDLHVYARFAHVYT